MSSNISELTGPSPRRSARIVAAAQQTAARVTAAFGAARPTQEGTQGEQAGGDSDHTLSPQLAEPQPVTAQAPSDPGPSGTLLQGRGETSQPPLPPVEEEPPASGESELQATQIVAATSAVGSENTELNPEGDPTDPEGTPPPDTDPQLSDTDSEDDDMRDPIPMFEQTSGRAVHKWTDKLHRWDTMQSLHHGKNWTPAQYCRLLACCFESDSVGMTYFKEHSPAWLQAAEAPDAASDFLTLMTEGYIKKFGEPTEAEIEAWENLSMDPRNQTPSAYAMEVKTRGELMLQFGRINKSEIICKFLDTLPSDLKDQMVHFELRHSLYSGNYELQEYAKEADTLWQALSQKKMDTRRQATNPSGRPRPQARPQDRQRNQGETQEEWGRRTRKKDVGVNNRSDSPGRRETREPTGRRNTRTDREGRETRAQATPDRTPANPRFTPTRTTYPPPPSQKKEKWSSRKEQTASGSTPTGKSAEKGSKSANVVEAPYTDDEEYYDDGNHGVALMTCYEALHSMDLRPEERCVTVQGEQQMLAEVTQLVQQLRGLVEQVSSTVSAPTPASPEVLPQETAPTPVTVAEPPAIPRAPELLPPSPSVAACIASGQEERAEPMGQDITLIATPSLTIYRQTWQQRVAHIKAEELLAILSGAMALENVQLGTAQFIQVLLDEQGESTVQQMLGPEPRTLREIDLGQLEPQQWEQYSEIRASACIKALELRRIMANWDHHRGTVEWMDTVHRLEFVESYYRSLGIPMQPFSDLVRGLVNHETDSQLAQACMLNPKNIELQEPSLLPHSALNIIHNWQDECTIRMVFPTGHWHAPGAPFNPQKGISLSHQLSVMQFTHMCMGRALSMGLPAGVPYAQLEQLLLEAAIQTHADIHQALTDMKGARAEWALLTVCNHISSRLQTEYQWIMQNQQPSTVPESLWVQILGTNSNSLQPSLQPNVNLATALLIKHALARIDRAARPDTTYIACTTWAPNSDLQFGGGEVVDTSCDLEHPTSNHKSITNEEGEPSTVTTAKHLDLVNSTLELLEKLQSVPTTIKHAKEESGSSPAVSQLVDAVLAFTAEDTLPIACTVTNVDIQQVANTTTQDTHLHSRVGNRVITPAHLVQMTTPDGTVANTDDSIRIDEEHGWAYGMHPGITPEQQRRLEEVLVNNKKSFAYSNAELPGYSGDMGPYRIELDTDKPIYTPARRYSVLERDIMDEKAGDLRDADIIKPVITTKYVCAPTMPAKKDAQGNWTDRRFCIDYRPLNQHTLTDKYGLPLPDDLFQQIGDSVIFSKLDLRAGFHQIPIAQEDQEKTTFWWGTQTWCYKRVPFGLKNATAYFCRVVDHEVMKAGLTENVKSFVDDILIHSKTVEDHILHVEQVLQMLYDVDLRAHPEKSVFGAATTEYIGHNVSEHGLSPHEAKVAAIRALPAPKDVSELRSILGFCNYYRCYVPNFSSIAAPMNELLKKDKPWDWGDRQQAALERLKEELCAEGRALRRADDNLPFIVYTDWSQYGIGAVLAQPHVDGEYMVACISRSLNVHEKNYSSYEGEMLAAVWAIKTFRHFLHGRKFEVVTDHRPLVWLMNNNSLTGKHARWALSLQDFDFVIRHRAGSSHCNADVPSRFPCPDDTDNTGARLDHVHPVSNIAACLALYPDGQDELSLVSLVNNLGIGVTRDDLMKGNLHEKETAWTDADVSPEAEGAQELRWAAQQMLSLAAISPESTAHTPISVDNTPVHPSFYHTAKTEGVVLMELCGGLCAGLEMLLRNGVKIRRYMYSDTSKLARTVAKYRVESLAAQYPTLLQPHEADVMFSTLPQDINQIQVTHLVEAGVYQGEQWMLIAGWDCSDLSPAGTNAGLQGDKSRTYHAVVKILSLMQELQEGRPPAYVLENAATQHNFNSLFIKHEVTKELWETLGQPVTLDAAQFNSYAHRLRNYWTNLADPKHVQQACNEYKRNPALRVNDILEPGRRSQTARRTEPTQFYPCNIPGEPLGALPTLVSYKGSHSFRNGNPGMIITVQTNELSEPTALERERALGYKDNTTAAPGVTEQQRRDVLGKCIDANVAQTLYATCQVTATTIPTHTHPKSSVRTQCVTMLGGEPWECISCPTVLPMQDGEAQSNDIWHDNNTLHLVQHGSHHEEASLEEQKRAAKRAKNYAFVGGKLMRVMANGENRIIPKPEVRLQLIQQTHAQVGHFGVRRTTHLLQTQHWWKGLTKDVGNTLAQCGYCDKIRSSFTGPTAVLQPLPIAGMFYRWGIDLTGPFPTTAQKNKHVFVAIEHYSKHVVLVPIPSRESAQTKHAFLTQILSRYGSCAEVLTDGGTEFQKEFDQMLVDLLIDHRTTSPNHPQADGLAERAVQTVKRALKKWIEEKETTERWDEDALPWIALGYNCSKQQSTGYSPYFLLHGIEPVIPPSIKERVAVPLDAEDIALDVDALLERAGAIRHAGVCAGGNLLIAQHRDTLRYSMIRSGAYMPRIKRYQEGDYVYLRHGKPNAKLDVSHYGTILRVVRILPSGRLRLLGRDNREITANVINVAPCHLPNIDGRMDRMIEEDDYDLPCEICSFTDVTEEHMMLICDGCDTGWHMSCMKPALTEIPEKEWICPRCVGQGLTLSDLQPREKAPPRERRNSKFASASQKKAIKEAKELDGVTIQAKGKDKQVAGLTGTVKLVMKGTKATFTATFDNGAVLENLSPTWVKRRQQHVASSAFVACNTLEPDMTDPETVSWMLQDLMPGRWHEAHATRLAHKWQTLKPTEENPVEVPDISVTLEEVQELMEVIDGTMLGGILDPWASTGKIARYYELKGVKVYTNDVNPAFEADFNMDPLQPGSYQVMEQEIRIDAIIASPWFALLDLAIPLALRAAQSVVCTHVPGHYISDAHPIRRRWLNELISEDRLHVLYGLPKGPLGRRCAWLIVFASPQLKRALLKHDVEMRATFSYAS